MIIRVIFSGIVATLLMTAFVYGVALLYNKKWKVIKVLGTMLTGETSVYGSLSGSVKAIVTGTVVHYAIGVGFACIYFWLLKKGIAEATISSSILFGIMCGLAGAAGWLVFFKMHRRPPVIRLPKYLLTIATGHIVFGVGLLILFRMMGISA